LRTPAENVEFLAPLAAAEGRTPEDFRPSEK